ncbi:hypothetical protein, partial [Oceanospirillum multiglobuliferum]|uniref:hypothetical protein n=1 Tax=Oceanospirillum multiglobuliferum TaxID=64969 RepID=UPI001473E718
MANITIRTSEDGWLKKLAEAYKNETPVMIIDDADVGIDLSNQSLFDMGKQADLSNREIAAVAISCGMSRVFIVLCHPFLKDRRAGLFGLRSGCSTETMSGSSFAPDASTS